jgi:hypothetical protein
MSNLSKLTSTLVLSFTVYITGISAANALTSSLSWTGADPFTSQTYTLTGAFTGSDLNNDGFIRSSTANEITDFNISFFKDPATLLASYNFAQITGDSVFNFNYQISNNTILQTGILGDLNGLSIGNSNDGYSLDSFQFSTLGTLIFNDYTSGFDSGSGGTLIADPIPQTSVPFEMDARLGLVALGALCICDRLKRQFVK